MRGIMYEQFGISMIQVWSLFGHWQEAQSLSEIAQSWLKLF